MIKRNTWIVLGGFVVLLALSYYIRQTPGLQGVPTLADLPTQSPPIFSFDSEDVVGITVSDIEGAMVVYALGEEALWVMSEPEAAAEDLNPGQIAFVVSQLSTWTEQNEVIAITDLEVVGLEQPAYTVLITFGDGSQQKFTVGEQTLNSTGYYLSVENGLPIIVSKFSVDTILDLLNSPPLLPTATPLIDFDAELTEAAADPQEPQETPSQPSQTATSSEPSQTATPEE